MMMRNEQDDDANVSAMMVGATRPPSPTTPALLSAARLDEIRDVATLHDNGEVEQDAQTIADDRRDLLAHLDALTAPAPADGGEALGRMARRAKHAALGLDDVMPWEDLHAETVEGYVAMGLALDAHGYARGVAAGEAERTVAEERLRKLIGDDAGTLSDVMFGAASEIARLTAALRTETTTKEQVQDQLVERRAAYRAEWERAERLTAELAEARATAERWKAACEKTEGAMHLADREDDRRVAAARLDGAREEREACVGDMRAAIRDVREKPVIDRAEQAIRARGEDRPPCPGEGWEWDAFALQWFQPGAKGKAIATRRARGEGQGS